MIKSFLKKNWKLLVSSLFVGVCIGITAVYFVLTPTYESMLTKCNLDVLQNERKLASFCNGLDVGGARLTEVKCDDKLELCLCGNPDILNPGGKINETK
jgi:hypothetical protein